MKLSLSRDAFGWRRLMLLIGLALVAVMLAASPAWAAQTREGDRIEVGRGKVVHDDLYAFGNTVVVDGTVKGDLVAAGGRVIVNGTVDGDLISAAQVVQVNGTVKDDARIAGQALVLGDNASVKDDLFAGGYSLESKPGSTVGGSLYYGGYQSLLAGTVGENLKAGANALELRGDVNGNVNTAMGDTSGGAPPSGFMPASPVSIPSVKPGLTLTDSARVGGNIAYASSDKARIANGAQIGGNVSHKNVPAAQQGTTTNPVAAAIYDHLRRFVTLLLVGLLALWIAPGWTRRMADNVRGKPLQSLGWGVVGSVTVFAAVFVGLLAAILLAVVFGLLTLGGVAFWSTWAWVLASAVLVGAYLITAAYLAPIVVALSGGRLLFRARQPEQRIGAMLALAIGLFIYVALRAIPIVGFLVGLAVVLLGVGAVSGWLWAALRSGKPVAEEHVAESTPEPDEPVASEPQAKEKMS